MGLREGTVSGQVEQDQLPDCRSYHRFYFIILMSVDVIPGHVNPLFGMLLKQSREQLSNLLAAFVALELDHRLPCMIVDGANADRAVSAIGLHQAQ